MATESRFGAGRIAAKVGNGLLPPTDVLADTPLASREHEYL